jgi:hypothetical protein
MDVCISVAGANRSDDFFELLASDLLADISAADSDNARGRNRPSEGTRPIGAVRRPAGTEIRRGLQTK